MNCVAPVTDFRKVDHQQERIVDKFLHKFFYSKLFKSVETVTDFSRQVAGVDVIADGMYIDNKAQSSPKYVNNPTNTFILELSFLNKYDEESVGWFLSDTSQTTHYLFVWVNNALVDYNRRILPDGIREVEVLLVDKQKLRDKISKYYSDDRLLTIANEMRETESTWMPCKIPLCKFSHSPTYREKPTNIVAKKDFFIECSTMHCIVSTDNIVHI